MGHQKFNYQSLEEIRSSIDSMGITMDSTTDLSILGTPRAVGNKLAPNRFAVLPMEGCDSNPDGSPSELVYRRYERFAAGGAGLLWGEANAVVPEGRANPQQMMLTQENLPKFKDLVAHTHAAATAKDPIIILQLTHSGRYSRPNTHMPEPMVPQRDPILDPRTRVVSDDQVVTDAYLESLVPKYVQSALLAKEAGFDGVDIKACHRYLLSELLASHTRPGKYGGSFENRSRLLLDIIRAVREAVGNDFIIAVRFNVFDAHPYPYGFGCDTQDMWKFDPTEPVQLVKLMCEAGAQLLSNSAGNPYYIYPQVTRPFDISSLGIPTPEESQLVSIQRLFMFTKTVQQAAGDIPVVGNGYTWLRNLLPYFAAENIRNGDCSFVGLGRSSFAYPDAPKDILETGRMEPGKCCVSCSKCTQIMRDHGMTGCVVRDAKVYAPLAKQYQAEREQREAQA